MRIVKMLTVAAAGSGYFYLPSHKERLIRRISVWSRTQTGWTAMLLPKLGSVSAVNVERDWIAFFTQDFPQWNFTEEAKFPCYEVQMQIFNDNAAENYFVIIIELSETLKGKYVSI